MTAEEILRKALAGEHIYSDSYNEREWKVFLDAMHTYGKLCFEAGRKCYDVVNDAGDASTAFAYPTYDDFKKRGEITWQKY